jgi:hypothetical protein
MKRVLQVVLSVMRELFDESAYARFLQRNSLAESRQSYAAFLKEQKASKATRVRCC